MRARHSATARHHQRIQCFNAARKRKPPKRHDGINKGIQIANMKRVRDRRGPGNRRDAGRRKQNQQSTPCGVNPAAPNFAIANELRARRRQRRCDFRCLRTIFRADDFFAFWAFSACKDNIDFCDLGIAKRAAQIFPPPANKQKNHKEISSRGQIIFRKMEAENIPIKNAKTIKPDERERARGKGK